MKKVTLVVFALLLIVAAGYLMYQAIYNPIIISFAPTQQPAPTLWPGIQLIPKTDQMQLAHPLWSPDGETIVAGKTVYPNPDFCFFCDPPYSEIYLISPSTKSVTSFLEGSGDLSARAWFPGGQAIVVWSYSGGIGNGVFLINISDASISPAPTYFDIDDSIDWSRKGNEAIVFDRIMYARHELRIVDSVTEEETLLHTIRTSSDYMRLSEPSLSPDGKTVAFSYGESEVDYHSVDTEVYLLDIETIDLIQFTHDSTHDNNSPRFSPDGKMISYQKYYQDISEWRTVIVQLDNGCEWEVPLPNAYTSSWAADSQNIVIGGNGIYLVDLKELFGDNFPSSIECP